MTARSGLHRDMKNMQVFDTWNHAGEYENTFYTAPFQEILLPEPSRKTGTKAPKNATHVFKIKAPLLRSNEAVCISGNGEGFGDWSMEDPLIGKRQGNWWVIELNLSGMAFPAQYKYGIYDVKHKALVQFEHGPNRVLPGDAQEGCLTILHDGFIHLPNSTWKGAGVSIPVFSLEAKILWEPASLLISGCWWTGHIRPGSNSSRSFRSMTLPPQEPGWIPIPMAPFQLLPCIRFTLTWKKWPGRKIPIS